MFITIKIHQHEVGLRFRDGDFAGVLRPGRHLVRSPLLGRFGDRVERVSMLDLRFRHDLLDVLALSAEFRSVFHVIDLSDDERAIVKREGRVIWVFGPGRHAFPKGPRTLAFERLDVTQVRFEHPQIDAVLEAPGGRHYLEELPVPAGHELLVFRGVLSTDAR